MKTKIMRIATMAVMMLAATSMAEAQESANGGGGTRYTSGPCLPAIHAMEDHQSAWCYIDQITNLVAGWNWVSFNAKINMADLQEALLAAYPNPSMNALVVKSKGNGQTAYNPTAHRWIGSLTTLDLSQMYMVKGPTAHEITMVGMPVKPADHPATIAPGANWIAFPLGQSMSITDAFAGFPTNGDIIKAKGGGQAQWNSAANRWIGALVNAPLQPGQGYMYNSKATGNRTFTFPASAK